MKLLIFGAIITICMTSSAKGQSPLQPPKSLPGVTLDCYQSSVSSIALPEDGNRNLSVDGDNVSPPRPRYRLQVVENSTLKIIETPTVPERRTEYGKHIREMIGDFMRKRALVTWREDDSGGGVSLFTLNFEDRLFTIVKIPAAKSLVPLVYVRVMKCQEPPK